MSKKKSRSFGIIFLFLGIVFSVLAICLAALPGLTLKLEVETTVGAIKGTVISNISLFGLIFGNGLIKVSTEVTAGSGSLGGNSDPIQLYGGMSTLALISFLAIALGVVFSLLAIFLRKGRKGLLGFAGLLVVVGAALIFALKVTGTPIGITQDGERTLDFVKYFADYNYGIGTILYFISSLIGSGCFILGALKS